VTALRRWTSCVCADRRSRTPVWPSPGQS